MNKSVNKMKQAVQEAEHKTKTWEENWHRLNKVVALACTNFVDEGITNLNGSKIQGHSTWRHRRRPSKEIFKVRRTDKTKHTLEVIEERR